MFGAGLGRHGKITKCWWFNRSDLPALSLGFWVAWLQGIIVITCRALRGFAREFRTASTQLNKAREGREPLRGLLFLTDQVMSPPATTTNRPLCWPRLQKRAGILKGSLTINLNEIMICPTFANELQTLCKTLFSFQFTSKPISFLVTTNLGYRLMH